MTPRQTPSPAVEATGRTPAVTGDREPETDPLILRTKLHRPRLASDYVARQRLLDRMDRVMEMPLNLISAPAGSGKSVVAAAWLESRSIRSMWLSLDGADSDLSRFLAYLVAGLEDSFPGHFDAFASLLGAPELPPVSTIATFLINDFDRMGAPSVLVLDDYHVLEKTSPVHELVTLLLEHAPPNLHLVLCSRVDPPLPLAKMRAGNRINDLQLSDLKFTRQESGELLKKIAEHDFTEDAVNRINTSVEGWAVGLRLAALAARAAPDRELFLDQLDSGLPDLTSYLMDEVLAALPAATGAQTTPRSEQQPPPSGDRLQIPPSVRRPQAPLDRNSMLDLRRRLVELDRLLQRERHRPSKKSACVSEGTFSARPVLRLPPTAGEKRRVRRCHP